MKPSLLQRMTPWWLLSFINRRTHTCWAEMVAWKNGWGWNESISWKPRADCWGGPGDGYDYCGRWQKREEMWPQ